MSKKYYWIYKGYQVLSQFSQEPFSKCKTLKEIFPFLPPDVYPVGRLDSDSEGLLILTNDKQLNVKLLNPNQKMVKTYWVQLEGEISDLAIEQLSSGVTIRLPDGSYYQTLPAEVKKIVQPLSLPERNPPIRFRKNQPTSWITISLQEGKNRQIRKMCAAVGFPVLRLIRFSIGNFCLPEFKENIIKEIDELKLFKMLFTNNYRKL